MLVIPALELHNNTMNNNLNFFERIGVEVVKAGRIPNHVAVIMDGNRRYAKRDGQPTAVGHRKGYERLMENMKWCLALEIKVLTVYAFSIENFKRSPQEVDHLMNFCRSKFTELLEDIDKINEMGVRFAMPGRFSMAPHEIQQVFAKLIVATRNNDKLLVNIAFAYTGRDEISRAASKLITGVRSHRLSTEEVTEKLMSQTLDVGPPDLLIRTSGETRLSDFLLWQLTDTVICFSEVLWPEWSLWNFVHMLLHYQIHAPPPRPQINNSIKQQKFLKLIEEDTLKEMEKIANPVNGLVVPQLKIQMWGN